MQFIDIATCFFSATAIIISIIDLIRSIKINKQQQELEKKTAEVTERSMKIQEGQIELEMANQISSAKKYIDNIELSIASMHDEKTQKAILQKKLNFAIEEVLNAYENICQKYIDNKTDKNRFAKTYKREIANLFSKDSIFREKLDVQSSPYKAIKKVYDEWENLEK